MTWAATAAVASATLTPMAPAGLMVWAASPISSTPSRAQCRTKRMTPSSGKNGVKSRSPSAKGAKIASKRRTRVGHRRHAIGAPAPPLAGRQQDAGLDVVRVLRQHQPADLAQRDVEGAGPAGRLLDREPDDVEVVVLVLRLELAELARPPSGARRHPPRRRRGPRTAPGRAGARARRPRGRPPRSAPSPWRPSSTGRTETAAPCAAAHPGRSAAASRSRTDTGARCARRRTRRPRGRRAGSCRPPAASVAGP